MLKWKTFADMAINKNCSVPREEYLDYMTFRRNERPLFTEIFGPLIGLKEEWEAQGASGDELDFSAFPYRCEARGFVPVNTGREGGRSPETLEETADFKIWRDELGRTMKLSKSAATLPVPLDYPVKTMDDWMELRPLYEFSESRFGENWEGTARKHLGEKKVVCVSIPGGFDLPRALMGEEQLCLAYYRQPELVRNIINTVGETALKVLNRVSSRVQIDLLSVHEDMAGNCGPLAGPSQVREFIAPYYRQIWEMLAARGARLFDQDSDGNMNPVIDAFLEAGVNCMHPMEPAAGMDIVRVREQYGSRLAFYGGIDKHVLRGTKCDIVEELEYKIPPMVRTGGCVIALDHRIPNGTPLENYRFYISKAWEIMEGCGAGK